MASAVHNTSPYKPCLSHYPMTDIADTIFLDWFWNDGFNHWWRSREGSLNCHIKPIEQIVNHMEEHVKIKLTRQAVDKIWPLEDHTRGRSVLFGSWNVFPLWVNRVHLNLLIFKLDFLILFDSNLISNWFFSYVSLFLLVN